MGELTDQERGTPAELEGRCEQCRGALTESEDSPSFFFLFFLSFYLLLLWWWFFCIEPGTFTHPKDQMLPQ